MTKKPVENVKTLFNWAKDTLTGSAIVTKQKDGIRYKRSYMHGRGFSGQFQIIFPKGAKGRIVEIGQKPNSKKFTVKTWVTPTSSEPICAEGSAAQVREYVLAIRPAPSNRPAVAPAAAESAALG